MAGIAQKDYSIDNGKIEFSGNFFDKFIKGGANSGCLSFTHGKVSGFGVDENYHTLLNYGLTRQQSLSEKKLAYSFLFRDNMAWICLLLMPSKLPELVIRIT